jgi:hypothetical protein
MTAKADDPPTVLVGGDVVTLPEISDWVSWAGPGTFKEYAREFSHHSCEFIVLMWAFLLDGIKAIFVFTGFLAVEVVVILLSRIYEDIAGTLGMVPDFILSSLKGFILVFGAVTVFWILAMGAINVAYAASRTTGFYAILRIFEKRKHQKEGLPRRTTT